MLHAGTRGCPSPPEKQVSSYLSVDQWEPTALKCGRRGGSDLSTEGDGVRGDC